MASIASGAASVDASIRRSACIFATFRCRLAELNCFSSFSLIAPRYGLADIARHVTGRHLTQETRTESVLDTMWRGVSARPYPAHRVIAEVHRIRVLVPHIGPSMYGSPRRRMPFPT